MIGYYIHHQGRGHLERARVITRALDHPVTALTSLPSGGGDEVFADCVELARDDADGSATAHDAGGALHWAPLHAPGYAQRMAQLAAWIAAARPALVVVDVSVEVTVLCRTLGVPVVVLAGPGSRTDPAHTLAYRLADAILAPWPGRLYRPAHLLPFAAKTSYVGAISRFDDRVATPRPGDGRVLLLVGAGGSALTTELVGLARDAVAGRDWSVRGVAGEQWSTDVWADLAAADVVVTHAGQNSLAEVAAARRPAVVLPQPRPFGEQAATAEVLRSHSLAEVCDVWPPPDRWGELLAAAEALGGDGWQRWNPGDGAALAARTIEKLLT